MKIKRMLIIALLAILMVIGSNAYVVKAEHDEKDYYYQSYDITVDVYDDRTYWVTEKLDVYFNTEKHGILRTIPTNSTVEGYQIEDIVVTGAPYTVEQNYSNQKIRIGSAEYYVEGLQHYEITYKLVHYKDYDTDYDFMYMNLLGTEIDTYVDSFKGTIILHDGLSINSQNVTSGRSGSTTNEFVEIEENENVYTYTASDIKAYKGITVMMYMDEGAFIHAPEYVFDYEILRENINIEMTEEKELLVRCFYEIKNNLDTVSQIVSHNAELGDSAMVVIKDYKTIKGSASLSDDEVEMSLNPGETAIFEFSYTLRYRSLTADNSLNLTPFSKYDTKLQNLHYYIQFPCEFTYNVVCGRNGDGASKFTASSNNNCLLVETNSPIYEGESLTIGLYYDTDVFYREYPVVGGIMAYVVAALTAAVMILKRKKKIKDYRFEVPANLNSMEIGYLYHKLHFTDSVISSMFVYWASKGYLTIHQKDKKNWDLKKEKEMNGKRDRSNDWKIDPYEKAMFNGLFASSETKTVDSKSLTKNKYYRYVDSAKTAIEKKYESGKYKICNEESKFMQFIQIEALVFAIFIIICGANLYFEYATISSVLLFILIVGGLWGFEIYLYIKRYKETGKFSIWRSVLLLFVLMLILGVALLDVFAEETFAVVFFAIVLSFLLCFALFKNKNYTPLGEELMLEIEQFRNFLANYNPEDDDLAMMMEYDMLPYAIALDLDERWIMKFRKVSAGAPAWYIYDSPYLADDHNWCYNCRRFHRDYRPCIRNPYAYSGSGSSYSGGYSGGGSSSGGYSGGGSSSSGGGHSGGGSGGGGSSSW